MAGIIGLTERTIRRLEKEKSKNKIIEFEPAEDAESIFEDPEEGWIAQYTKELGACTPESRSWNFVVYPESAPEDWVDVFLRTGCPLLVGPLHGRCKWKKDDKQGRYKAGDPKKPHYHANIKLPKKISLKKAAMLIQKVTHGLLPQPCEDEHGLYQYVQHRHKDSSPIEGKELYPEEEIQLFNGWEPERSEMDKLRMRQQLDRFLTTNQITNFSVAITAVRAELGKEYSALLRQDSHYYRGLIDGNRHLTEGDIAYIQQIIATEVREAAEEERHWKQQENAKEKEIIET